MRAAERMEAIGLAMPLPSISGADPWTLEVAVSRLEQGEHTMNNSRLAHHEVIACVNRRDEAERPNKGSGSVTV